MNKKILLLLPVTLLALTSCGGNTEPSSKPSDSSGTSETTSETTSIETTSEEATSEEETTSEESTSETTSEESATSEEESDKSIVLNVFNLNSSFATLNLTKDAKYEPGANKFTVNAGTQLTMQQKGFTADNYKNVFVVINDAIFQPTVAPESEVTSLEVDVTIPETDFNAFVYFQTSARKDDGYSVELANKDITLVGSISGDKFNNFSGYVILPENELIDSATYKVGDNEPLILPTTRSGLYYLNHPNNLPGNVYQLNLGRSDKPIEGNISVSIIHSHHEIYKINYEGLTDKLVNIGLSSIVYEAYDSTKVSLYLNLKKSATTQVSSSDVTLDFDGAYYNFEMPAKDITIKIEEVDPNVTLTVNSNPDISYAKFFKDNDFYSSEITKGYNSTTVYLFVAVKNNIKPTKVTYGTSDEATFSYKGFDDNESNPARLYVAPINIPDTGDSLSVTVITSEAHLVEVAEDIELTVSGGTYFVSGETVTALFSDESKQLIIKDKEGNVLDIEQTRYEARRVFAGMRFTMPDCDIVLSFGD